MATRRSTRSERESIEAETHLRQAMAGLGWKCVGYTGTGKPNRFEKKIPGYHEFYVTSAPLGLWRLERYTGYSFQVKGAQIRKMAQCVTYRYGTAIGMALWFDYVGQTLLRIPYDGN